MTTVANNDPIKNLLREAGEIEKAASAMLAALKIALHWATDDEGEVWAHSTIEQVKAAIAAAEAAGIKVQS